MALPVPPTVDNPIPNNPFYSLPAYITKGAYYPITVGAGLSVDPVTAVITSTGGGGGAVTSLIAGPGINVSSATGNVTVTNTGVTNILAGTGISISGGTGSVTINSLTTGTVIAINTGAGLTGGPITTSGTIALTTTGVTPGTYTNATINVDGYGRISLASSGTSVSSVSGALPITVSAGANPVIGINPASTTSCGAVLLSDSINSTSSATAATSLALKTAYDIAIAAIPKSCITGKGALITGTAASTPVALSVGTNGQVLTACSACVGGLYWAAASAGVVSATPTVQGIMYGCTIDRSFGLYGVTALGCCAFNNGALGGINPSTAIGYKAMAGVGGPFNVAVGQFALCTGGEGNDNVVIGDYAGFGAGAGSFNTMLGGKAGCAITTGNNNLALGYNVQVAAPAGNCQLAIGFESGQYWLTGDGTKAIQPGAGIIDCSGSCGTANMVLTSQGNAIEWKSTCSVKPAPSYGSFLNTGTQIIGTVNVPQPVTLNTTLASSGFTLVGGSQITATNAGVYNLQFSIQLVVTTGGGGNVEIWLAKNGSAVPNSNTRFAVKNVNEAEFAALNYVESLNAGDNLQLIWVTDDVHIQLFSYAAGANFAAAPAIPSAIVTIVPVGA